MRQDVNIRYYVSIVFEAAPVLYDVSLIYPDHQLSLWRASEVNAVAYYLLRTLKLVVNASVERQKHMSIGFSTASATAGL